MLDIEEWLDEIVGEEAGMPILRRHMYGKLTGVITEAYHAGYQARVIEEQRNENAHPDCTA